MAKTRKTKTFSGIRLVPFRRNQAKPEEDLPKAPVFDQPAIKIIGDPIIISDSEPEEDAIIISDDEADQDCSFSSSSSDYECDSASDVELPGEDEDSDAERQRVIEEVYSPKCCPTEGPFPPKCERIRLWSMEDRLCKHCGVALSDAQHARAHEAIEHGGLCQCGRFRYSSFRDYHSHVKDCPFNPVFYCPFEHCGEAFRSIFEQFHHMTNCDESEHPTGNKRFIFMGRRVSRIPDWYKDSDEDSEEDAVTTDEED